MRNTELLELISKVSTEGVLLLKGGVCMRDCAEGPEIRILEKRDYAEGLEFGGAKRRRKFLGF